MKFHLKFDVPENVLGLSHRDQFVCLGSCFAEEMSAQLNYSGFHQLSNPFGVIFHPLPLAEIIRAALNEENKVNSFQRDDLWFSWDAASQCYAYSREELEKTVLNTRSNLRVALRESAVLVITFGTAWGYRLLESGNIVANCHKIPQKKFEKELTDTRAMIRVWKDLLSDLQEFNPNLKVIFTVSPVRHIKDGLVENNRSKARLIELAHACSERENVHYFPAYEIVLDELRDYRFYAEDMVHPSEQAIEFVWQRFSRYCFTSESLALANDTRGLRKLMEHISLHPGSDEDQKRIATIQQKLEKFKSDHPEVYLGE